MKRIWNTYKVWILIGIAFIDIYFFKSFKELKHIFSINKLKISISSVERVLIWISPMCHRLAICFKT